MKIAICDDEPVVVEKLREFVCRYASDHLLDCTVLEFNRGEALLEAVRRDSDIRVLFLDIYMSPLSGMALAKTLRAEGNDCAIIFVTISTDYYAQSYEVDAKHYLVKPVTFERVAKALQRCRQALDEAAQCASFSSGGRKILIPLGQIRYVEVFRNQTVVHATGDIPLRCTLDTAALRLPSRWFFRVHRSFLVNMNYIAHRDGNDIYLTTGEKVPLSRSRAKTFEREYGRFLTASMTNEKATGDSI